jgi:hypothetical protein
MITLTSSSIKTVDNNGNEIDLISQSGSSVLTGGMNVVTERKRLKARFSISADDYDSHVTLAGQKIFVNIALFIQESIASVLQPSPHSTGWCLQVPSDISPSESPTALRMGFYSNNNPYPEAVRNLNAWFYYYADNDFQIEIEYYNCFDENDYLNNIVKNNQWRFISEYWNENNTKEIDQSVFNVAKEIRLLVHIENPPTELDRSNGKFDQAETIIYRDTVDKYSSRIEVNNPDGEAITHISTAIDTDVVVKIYTDQTLDTFYAKLIKIQNDPAYNFIDNYDLQENKIDSGNLTYNVFKGPFSVDAAGYDDPHYDLTFKIDHSYIEEGVNYRLIISAYDLSGGIRSAIGVSGQYVGRSVVSYCDAICPTSVDEPSGLLITPTLIDMHQEYTGNSLTCAIEERMRTKVIVDFSDDRWKRHIDCRRGLTGETVTSNDIRKYLAGVNLEFYTEYTDTTLGGTVRNILDSQFIQRISTNNYQSAGINFTFDMVGETLTMYYDFRNRNDTNQFPIYSFLNGNPYLPIQGDQYWGGKTIYIKWQLVFYYSDFTLPYYDNLNIMQRINVRDYSNDVTIDNINTDIFCDSGLFCMKGKILFSIPEDYKLFVTQQIVDSATISEAEGFVPDEFPQLTDPSISFTNTDYTGTDAIFCIDGSKLTINNKYKFSVFAKKWD